MVTMKVTIYLNKPVDHVDRVTYIDVDHVFLLKGEFVVVFNKPGGRAWHEDTKKVWFQMDNIEFFTTEADVPKLLHSPSPPPIPDWQHQ